MGKAIKLLILLSAAAAGAAYYQRYHALSNLLEAPAPVATGDAHSAAADVNGIGKVGGLGPVGNPYDAHPLNANEP